MRNNKIIWLCLLAGLILSSCRDRYEPDIDAAVTSYLVAEGILNTNGPTTIRLSRSTQLDTFLLRPETSASLVVEGRDNSARPLLNMGDGRFYSPDLNLSMGEEYRVKISSQGYDYVSEYVQAVVTPEVDSISWKLEDEGLRIYANTHDPSGNTRYYRWEYEETWEVRAYYYASYIYLPDGTVRERIMPAEEVYQGWKYNNSTSILTATSAKLQTDIISEAPLTFIPPRDEKLAVRYSILVRQYALDKKGYAFYQMMKRNTESLGTVFDPQPTDIRGNITCVTDPSIPVIGYIGANSITEKRIFINRSQLPAWGFRQTCQDYEVMNHPDSINLAFGGGGLEPYDAVFSEFNPDIIVKYKASGPICVDVRRRGASLTRPVYW
ncbi:MAG TPA: DUF4249 domain-containing protein [Chitinophagaceae bacterium]|nr:DUF4249 domain-containing protein [Chitinophagaceae bacterium]